MGRFELREVMSSAAHFHRPARHFTSAVGPAFAAGVCVVELFGATVAEAQVVLPRPPQIGDPTGRSNEPPPLFEELPHTIPVPGQILPPLRSPQPRETDDASGLQFLVRDIRVVGSTVFTEQQLAVVTSSYVNRKVTSEDLEALRIALTRLYVDKGYVNSGAVLPDQTVEAGVITYQIVEGKLDRIEMQGNRWLRERYYRDRLALAAGPPLNVDTLQERIQILLEDPRIERLNAELKPGASASEAILNVRAEERSPLKLWFDFDNYQAPSVGAERGVATIQHNSVTGNGDVLELSYGRSRGLDPLLDLGYTVPITARDTTLGIRYRKNDLVVVENPFASLNIESQSEVYTVSLRQPVYHTPSALATLELAGERTSLQTSVLGVPFDLEPGAVNGETVSTAVRFAQEFAYRTRDQVIAARSRFSVGVDALSATTHTDGKPDSEFFTWLGQFQWVRQFDTLAPVGMPNAQVIFRSDVQLSNKPLLTVEQIALGGRYTVRGYPQNTLVRDNAFITSIEGRLPILRNTRWADYLELAPFFDYGRGWNTNRPTTGPSDLAGVGIGVRWGMTIHSSVPIRPQFEIYWGHPLRKIDTSASAAEGNGLYFQLLIGAF
ncbi:MAG: ShlB/FhaC/HecB family hemolysin secretion/activation protein [Betaproteobacteria bacterium]